MPAFKPDIDAERQQLLWKRIIQDALYDSRHNRCPMRKVICCFRNLDQRCRLSLHPRNLAHQSKAEETLHSLFAQNNDFDLDQDLELWPSTIRSKLQKLAVQSMCEKHIKQRDKVSRYFVAAIRKAFREETARISGCQDLKTLDTMLKWSHSEMIKQLIAEELEAVRSGHPVDVLTQTESAQGYLKTKIEDLRTDVDGDSDQHRSKRQKTKTELRSFWESRISRYQASWRDIEGHTLFAPREVVTAQLDFPVENGGAARVGTPTVRAFYINAIGALPTTMARLSFLYTERERWSTRNLDRTFVRAGDRDDIESCGKVIREEVERAIRWEEKKTNSDTL